ncbi:DNA mismatch repair protein [Glugoides intestinalis]
MLCELKIKKLPENVISRIAAGEVIISPFNIIKELLENSFDAAASSITIQFDSCLQNISIRDNGSGIQEEDLEYLCMNHYTSKIETLTDLKRLGSIGSSSTYGFRGEALHSISLCSRLKVQTRKQGSDAEHGICAVYSNEKLLETTKCAFEGHGTLFEIRSIFYNNVIRSEYYSKSKAEVQRCIELITSYGIIGNGVECKVDGKVILGRDYSERRIEKEDIIENRKKYILENMITDRKATLKSIKKEEFMIICTDQHTKQKSYKCVLIVNKRLVENNLLKKRILQAYRKYKTESVPFVFIEMVVEYVDVNVHPSKAEVLIDYDAIYEEIIESLDTILKSDTIELGERAEIPGDSSINSISHNYSILSYQESISHPKETEIDNKLDKLADTSIFTDIMLSNNLKSQSPVKIYSSPYTRRLDEREEYKKTQNTRKFSLLSLKKLLDELEEVDSAFFRNLIFVGSFENFIFAQHQTNLIKIQKKAFLEHALYQKIIKEFGNFESIEVNVRMECELKEDLYEFLREYFGICIEKGYITAIPRLYDLSLKEDQIIKFAGFTTEKKTEIETIRFTANKIAAILSNCEVDSKLFNQVKVEIVGTREVIEIVSLLVDLKELYKTFDRC